jgi:hypothetical protein
VHSDLALKAVQMEEYPIVAYAEAKLAWPVFQGPHVPLKRLARELHERPIDSTPIIQWKPSQTSLCAS